MELTVQICTNSSDSRVSGCRCRSDLKIWPSGDRSCTSRGRAFWKTDCCHQSMSMLMAVLGAGCGNKAAVCAANMANMLKLERSAMLKLCSSVWLCHGLSSLGILGVGQPRYVNKSATRSIKWKNHGRTMEEPWKKTRFRTFLCTDSICRSSAL